MQTRKYMIVGTLRFAEARNVLLILIFSVLAVLSTAAFGQTAQVQGRVTDETGATISQAVVRIVDQRTNIVRSTHTSREGLYVVAGLNPSQYKISVMERGFKTEVSDVVTLNVDQHGVMDFVLHVGATSESVVVSASAMTLNTTDATVSTVVDHSFVENMPLNGRSFQDLILLTPGVTTRDPQVAEGGGEFSVNGMRTDANNVTVDGASANNVAGTSYSSAGSAGALSSATALGTTQAMLPVDAMQEFRIMSSTYSAEFGRAPGAQIRIQSRSGTNRYHGTLFDYLRNDALDANNWFNDYTTPVTPKQTERQNDFGGSLAGPLSVPRLYSAKDRAFFFFTYEGLRLTLPQATTVYYAPSNGTFNTGTYADARYKNMRANAPAALQPALNSYPVPNCDTTIYQQCVDYGDGLSPYIVRDLAWPSALDTIFLRLDLQATPWLHLFARYGDSVSFTSGGGGAYSVTKNNRTRVYLLGADSVFHGSVTNQLRLQYSPVSLLSQSHTLAYGGSTPIDLWTQHGLPSGSGTVNFYITMTASGAKALLTNLNNGSVQFQPNFTDTAAWQWRNHLFKVGVDGRQTTAYFGYRYFSQGPRVLYYYQTPTTLLTNTPTQTSIYNIYRQDVTTKNLGVFFQDEWRVWPRLSISAGVRWDLSPPPSISGAQNYTYAGDLSNPGGLTLAPLGTPLYRTTYTNFAPRLGIAYTLSNRPGWETVVRTGSGIFYDTGQAFSNGIFGSGSNIGNGWQITSHSAYPVDAGTIIAGPAPPIVAPYKLAYSTDRNLTPPYAIHWNVAVEQAIGGVQKLTVNYVASRGINLINFVEYPQVTPSPLAAFYVWQNGPGSNYQSFQAQFQRTVRKGLQALASYTWAHSIDSQSTDYQSLPVQRGNSQHDVRHNFAAAMVYDLPTNYVHRLERQIFGNWGVDLRVTARTAFPVQVTGPTIIDSVLGDEYPARVNWNGQNPYVHKPGIPGGRQINPAVFSLPTAAQGANGNAPRNFLRGFGMWQANMAIRRTFPLRENLNLQFRAEAFNVTNHPNFGALNLACGTTTKGATCNNVLMGQATNTLAGSLPGSGTFNGSMNSFYQQGGPRSLQMALKLQF